MRTPNTAPDITLEVPPFLRQQDAGGNSPPYPQLQFRKGGLDNPATARNPYCPTSYPKMRFSRDALDANQRFARRSTGTVAAHTERGPQGGNPHGKNHAPCMISGISTRKAVLDGKISAPRIPNRLIAPGNGRIGRGSCHFDLEKHAFRANIARKRACCVHSSKRERIWRDCCQAVS